MSRRTRSDLEAVDLAIGRHVRRRRKLLGMSQAELAGALGISFQQLSKLEIGQASVSASRLLGLSRALGVGPEYFFQGAP